jgi:hypothetical protein
LLELKSNLENTKLNSSKSSEESIVVGRPTWITKTPTRKYYLWGYIVTVKMARWFHCVNADYRITKTVLGLFVGNVLRPRQYRDRIFRVAAVGRIFQNSLAISASYITALWLLPTLKTFINFILQ